MEENQSDDETVEFDIEVVTSSSSVSLDQLEPEASAGQLPVEECAQDHLNAIELGDGNQEEEKAPRDNQRPASEERPPAQNEQPKPSESAGEHEQEREQERQLQQQQQQQQQNERLQEVNETKCDSDKIKKAQKEEEEEGEEFSQEPADDCSESASSTDDDEREHSDARFELVAGADVDDNGAPSSEDGDSREITATSGQQCESHATPIDRADCETAAEPPEATIQPHEDQQQQQQEIDKIPLGETPRSEAAHHDDGDEQAGADSHSEPQADDGALDSTDDAGCPECADDLRDQEKDEEQEEPVVAVQHEPPLQSSSTPDGAAAAKDDDGSRVFAIGLQAIECSILSEPFECHEEQVLSQALTRASALEAAPAERAATPPANDDDCQLAVTADVATPDQERDTVTPSQRPQVDISVRLDEAAAAADKTTRGEPTGERPESPALSACDSDSVHSSCLALNMQAHHVRRSSSAARLLMASSLLEDEDLEREFDEEPEFERREVLVKRNCDPRAQYTLGDELGRGKFGTVYRCVEGASGRALAAKFIHMRRREDREDVEREVAIMSVLQHKRLLQLYDAFDNGAQEMCLITELVEGGELFERIVDDDFDLTEKKAAIFMRQICEGVEYMHGQQIVHLDMKPENILCLSRTGIRIKLIDFGLARQLDPGKPIRVMFGTPDFAAPEVLGYEPVTLATDMWSVGVICYVLLSGLSPFMGDSDMETMANVMRATFDFNDHAFEAISDLAKDFISKLLVRDARERLKPNECLRHAWLARGGAPLEANIRSRRESAAVMISSHHRLALEQAALMAAAAATAAAAAAAQQAAEPNSPGTPPPPPHVPAHAGGVSFTPRASFGAESSASSAGAYSLDKRRLKKYVVRRKWHKTVHAIMALGRMGANLRL